MLKRLFQWMFKRAYSEELQKIKIMIKQFNDTPVQTVYVTYEHQHPNSDEMVTHAKNWMEDKYFVSWINGFRVLYSKELLEGTKENRELIVGKLQAINEVIVLATQQKVEYYDRLERVKNQINSEKEDDDE